MFLLGFFLVLFIKLKFTLVSRKCYIWTFFSLTVGVRQSNKKMFKLSLHKFMKMPAVRQAILNFNIAVGAQYWHFCSMLKIYVNIVSIETILSKQCWHIFLTLSKNVNVEIQCWAQTAMLKFNIACLTAGAYQPL